MNGEKYIIQTNQKKAGIAILISDKVDFKVRKVTRVKGHYVNEMDPGLKLPATLGSPLCKNSILTP